MFKNPQSYTCTHQHKCDDEKLKKKIMQGERRNV